MQPIVLYDTPSNDGKAWNMACSRMRYFLSLPHFADPVTVVLIYFTSHRFCFGFKGLPYKTEWVEYPNIEPTLRGIGAAPTGTRPDTGNPFYTLPVILDPNNITAEGTPTVISDSFNIAMYLDERYPTENQLIPKETQASQASFSEYFTTTVVIPAIPNFISGFFQILNEESKPYVPNLSQPFRKYYSHTMAQLF